MKEIRTSRGTLRIEYDPERPSSREYIAKDSQGRLVKLHLGHGDYLKIGSKERMEGHGDQELLCGLFEVLTGFDPVETEDWYDRRVYKRVHKKPLRCCSNQSGVWEKGFPGESLLICQSCREILESSFNPKEIE